VTLLGIAKRYIMVYISESPVHGWGWCQQLSMFHIENKSQMVHKALVCGALFLSWPKAKVMLQ